jgi:hypothetical protein
MLKENLKKLRENICTSAEKVGRNPEEIKVVAVCKNVNVEKIKEAIKLGIKHIAENRIQEARTKFPELKNYEVFWHMVGHLQRNKVKYAVEIFDYLHSLDSVELLEEIEKRMQSKEKKMETFIQVNTSGEKTKFGILPREVDELVDAVLRTKSCQLFGFMTIAPFTDDESIIRNCFRKLREIRDKVSKRLDIKLYLSMGMSNDYQIAVEEGADFLRIGRAIFGGEI